MPRLLGILLFVVAGFLLTSFGGLGIVAAPVTLPLLVLVVRCHPSRAFRVAAAIIGGLTTAELTWAVVYLVAGESSRAIWMVPTGCALATAFGFGALHGSTERHAPARGPRSPDDP